MKNLKVQTINLSLTQTQFRMLFSSFKYDDRSDYGWKTTDLQEQEDTLYDYLEKVHSEYNIPDEDIYHQAEIQ